jgi:hypothetical protein
MNEIFYKELIILLEQMIQDKVQLMHGGQIINWNETKIPELLQKIKDNAKPILQNRTIIDNKN